VVNISHNLKAVVT